MSDHSRQPVLHLVTCGTQQVDLESFITNCQHLGWDIHVIATPSAARTVDREALAQLSGHPVHEDDQPAPLYPLPPAWAVAVAPATFNTINKWAYGHNDNLALRLLNEATGLGLPIVVLPTPEPALVRHPALAESLARLRHWGVIVAADPTLGHLPSGGTQDRAGWRTAEQVIAGWTRFTQLPAPQSCPVFRIEDYADPSGGCHPLDDYAEPVGDYVDRLVEQVEPLARHDERVYHYSAAG